MSDKIESARRSISQIEERAANIMEEVKRLVDTDPRMKTDETFRNSLISGKLSEVHALQEQSLFHQSELRKYQMLTSAKSGSTTRSRASASESSTKITSVAANIQRLSRSQALPRVSTKGAVVEQPISESDQKKSIQSLFKCRNWLISREKELNILLSKEGLFPIDTGSHDLFTVVRSLRVRTEFLCSRLSVNPAQSQLSDELRNVIRYVEGFIVDNK